MIIKDVIMEHGENRYKAMPVQGYKDLYPGKFKCGKCLFGVIRPIIGIYPTPQCKRCGTKVRDIMFLEGWSSNLWNIKIYRYA